MLLFAYLSIPLSLEYKRVFRHVCLFSYSSGEIHLRGWGQNRNGWGERVSIQKEALLSSQGISYLALLWGYQISAQNFVSVFSYFLCECVMHLSEHQEKVVNNSLSS